VGVKCAYVSAKVAAGWARDGHARARVLSRRSMKGKRAPHMIRKTLNMIIRGSSSSVHNIQHGQGIGCRVRACLCVCVCVCLYVCVHECVHTQYRT